MNQKIDRRRFLAAGTTVLSYGRVAGANERILLGILGVGRRGSGLAWIVSQLKDKHNAG
jgi:hypothetical protein